MSEEWGPWIDHDGKGCPLVAGTIVMVVWICRGKVRIEGPYPTKGKTALHWESVVRYRIRKPRGLTILEGLLENLPERVPA